MGAHAIKTLGGKQDAPVHPDRRQFKRVNLALKVQFLQSDGAEYTATTINISPSNALLKSDHLPPIGEPVITYIDNIGRFEGRVVRHHEGAFGIIFTGRRSRQQKMADALTWVTNAETTGQQNQRTHPRLAENRSAVATLASGAQVECRILDISISGASVSISPKPAIGTPLTIGKMSGHVVRHHENGIGMVFANTSTIKQLRESL